MTRNQVDAIIERLDAHSKRLDRVSSDLDKLKGGILVIGILITAIIVPLIASVASALIK
jgi:hypothetical protein